MKSKKGNVVLLIVLVGLMFILVFAGLLMVIGASVLDFVFDEAVPELTGLGTVGSANLTEISGYTLEPVNNVVQNFTWLSGVIYILGLLGLIGLSAAFRMTGEKWLMSFFFVMMLLLIITCIFISIIYEDFYNGTDEIAIRLQEHTVLSFLLLYSPAIMSVVGFISGIIMFSGTEQGGFQ